MSFIINLGNIFNAELETEWCSVPICEQIGAAAPTNLTAGSITPTFPKGATLVRALLIACIHCANQSTNTHHIGIKVQGQKAAGGYSDLLDLTVTKPLALNNVDGSGDSWIGAIDVTTLVDTSAVVYDFRFVVSSDNAHNVNYTTCFTVVLVYHL
jgi:hypothetical protein